MCRLKGTRRRLPGGRGGKERNGRERPAELIAVKGRGQHSPYPFAGRRGHRGDARSGRQGFTYGKRRGDKGKRVMARTFWKEEYRIGIDELDDEHIELCALMARFRRALDDAEDRRVIGSVFRDLRGKMMTHFHDEEKILSRLDCPEDEVREHIDGHLDVLYTFEHAFSKWQKAPDDGLHQAGIANLCVWAIGELLDADMRMKDHLSGSGSHKTSGK